MDTLNLILRLFRDGDKLCTAYGCSIYNERIERTARLDESSSEISKKAKENLARSFSCFRVYDSVRPTSKPSMTNKAKWVIRDRQKFSELIQEVRNLINGLIDITKPLSTAARQEGMLRYKIQQIKDLDTLSLVSEVCQRDYPDVSDAATIKLDALTIVNGQSLRAIIETRAASVNEDPSWDGDDDDLESLTITELKALLRQRTEAQDEDLEMVKVESVIEPTGMSMKRPNGKTMEELALENITLKEMTDKLSRQQHDFQSFYMKNICTSQQNNEERSLDGEDNKLPAVRSSPKPETKIKIYGPLDTEGIDQLSASTALTRRDGFSRRPFRSDSQGNGKSSSGKLPPRSIFKKSTLSSAAET